MKEDRYYSRSYSRQQKTINVVIQIVLLVLGIMWILPLMWIILTSFRAEPGSYTSYFWPKGFTLDNYTRLLFEDQQFKFSQWFLNTFIVAVVSCIGQRHRAGCVLRAQPSALQDEKADDERCAYPRNVPRIHVDGSYLLHLKGSGSH